MNRKSIVLGLLAVGLLATPALATLPDGVSGVVQARGTLGEQLKVREAAGTDLAMQQITIQPGGHTGWHTHPGAALVIVKSGALTITSLKENRHGNRCFTTTYTAGQSFVDPGHGHVHIGRNLGTTPTELWVTYTGVPTGGAFRLDAAEPTC